MQDIVQKSGFEVPGKWKTIFVALGIIGVVTFLIGIASGNEEFKVRAWETLLINVMFWGGLAQAGVIWSVIWQVTDAKWGRPYKRLAEAFGAFLPVSFVMFIVVFLGAHVLYEWTHTPFLHHGHAVKAGWLNIYFFVARNIFWLLLMYGVSFAFMFLSLKPDFAEARKHVKGWGGKLGDFLLKGYGDPEKEAIEVEKGMRVLAPVLALIYSVAGSFLAWDFVMSLDQEWFSTLFGVFFLVGNMQACMGILIAIAVTVREKYQLEEWITINRIHDLAKLIFAFSLLYTYMAYSQYIVIWYGNIPEETPFLVIRSMLDPWSDMFVLLSVWIFISMFFILMPKTICRNPTLVRIIGIYIAIGQWLAIYFLVVPSLQKYGEYEIYMSWPEIGITLGFAGIFALCYLTMLGKVPLLPIGDRHLCKSWHGR